MSKIKELAAVHEKYIISVEHQLEPVPAVKATLTITGEGATYSKRVQTLFVPAQTLEDAEEAAVNQAISMILGNKQTKELVQSFEQLDITSVHFHVNKTGTLGVKSVITVFKDSKPYRTVQALATGADLAAVEKEALKNAVNKVMGVK
jgi:limonene-1,2-epoxide hydrolase